MIIPLDQIAALVAVVSCAALLVRVLRLGLAGQEGWAAKAVVILVLGATAAWVWPDGAAWLVFALWAVLIALPSTLLRMLGRRALQQRYAESLWLARLVAWLHPFDGWRSQPEVMRALAAAKHGEVDLAVAALTGLLDEGRLPLHRRPLMRAYVCRLTGDWEGIAALGETGSGLDRLALVQFRLRALGETGRLAELVRLFDQTHRRIDAPSLNLCRLFLFAFCGDPAATARLLNGALSPLDGDAKAYWIATAELAAGETAAGCRRLTALAESAADGLLRRAAARRLQLPLAPARDLLGPQETGVVAAAAAQADADRTYGDRGVGDLRRSYVVLAVVAIDSVLFLWQAWTAAPGRVPGLLRLGAMWPEAVVGDGEWWRLLSAIFLHLNTAHLALNMLALAALGPWVERVMGHGRTLAVYLAAGLASTAGVLLLIELGVMEDEILVGASGAVFGLVGAQLLLLLQGWRRMRSRLARLRSALLAAVILLQIGFDVTTPQVSFAGHVWGLVVGAAFTALLLAVGAVRAGPTEAAAPLKLRA